MGKPMGSILQLHFLKREKIERKLIPHCGELYDAVSCVSATTTTTTDFQMGKYKKKIKK